MGQDPRFSICIILAIQQASTVAHIRCDDRHACRKALQNGQRLPFTDAGQNRHIHPSQIVCNLNSACKLDIRNLHDLDHLKAFRRVVRVLIIRSHDPQFQLGAAFLCVGKCLNHRFYVFDRRHTENGPDMDISLMLRRNAGQILQFPIVNSIGCDHRLFRRASQLNLQLSCMLVKTGYNIRLIVRHLRHLFKLLNPNFLIEKLYPLRFDQFFFSLARIDSML